MMRQVVILKSWALRRGLLGLALILGLLAASQRRGVGPPARAAVLLWHGADDHGCLPAAGHRGGSTGAHRGRLDRSPQRDRGQPGALRL